MNNRQNPGDTHNVSDAPAPLDRLIEQLEELVRPASPLRQDAIDAVLSSEPRRTEVRPLRDDETVQRFREELHSGLVGAETAARLLELVGDLLRTVIV